MPPCYSAESIPTKIVVRATSKDAKVIGSGVGGALVRIRNVATGEILAEGRQAGGTGDTDRIMVRPHRRGEVIYDTPGTAYFQAEIALDKPTQVEITAEGPLNFSHAMQKGSKTLTLIPGKNISGDGIVIELNGLIVNALSPKAGEILERGKEVAVRAEVRML